MSNLFLTLVIAFLIIVFAIALLAIGWLIKGKTKVEKIDEQDLNKKTEESCCTDKIGEPLENQNSNVFEDQKFPPSTHS